MNSIMNDENVNQENTDQFWLMWFFTWKGRVARLPYFLAGIVLAGIKYLIDGLISTHFGVTWPVSSYLYNPLPPAIFGNHGQPLCLLLLAVDIPFFWMCIALTRRRLRDLGRGAGWTLLLFIPFINFALFLWLSLAPGTSSLDAPDASSSSLPLKYRLAIPGVLLAALLGLILAVASTHVNSYGMALFLGVPFLSGFVASWFLNLTSIRSGGDTTLASITPIGLIGVAMIFFKFEGLICLVMALPLAAPFAIAGGHAARDILSRYHNPQPRPLITCVAIIPLLIFAEYAAHLEPPVMPVTTSIVINAPVATVWKNVISFPPLAPPSVTKPEDWIFLTGIAYPTSGRIVGSGSGAVRYCQFSTGDFVEPITVWDENHLLAFNVASEPPAMHELSPWQIMPPHLEHNNLRSRHGQFRFIAIDDHHTLLEGTTWYQDYFWPQPYWRGWSDMIIHRIHMRVLEHVKQQAETP
jgi:uncharacterized membrane protein YhaH (DUF805 family)